MSSLNVLNIGLDVYSVLLCVMMGVYALLGERERHDKVSRCFAGICFANAVMALGDVTTWMFVPPLNEAEYALVMAGSFVFYAAVLAIYLFFTSYIASYLERRTQLVSVITKRRAVPLLLGVLFAVYLASCVASLWNGMLFTVTLEEGYARGDMYWVSQVFVISLHLFNTVLVLRCFSCLTLAERLGFVSYLVLPMAANLVQVALYGIALLNTFITITLFIIFISIQAERKALLARRDRELMEARANVMLSQIQPHFLYNTLTAIRELCLTDPDEAARTVTDFSAYLRENMASLTSSRPIPFERELQHAQTYLSLEQRRFGERLHVDFDIATTAFCLPPLSLQALAENAVRHGVVKRESGGCVRIVVREEPDAFTVAVRDDGVGFDVAHVADDGRQHVGIANVRARMEALMGGTLSVESTPGVGTCATLRVPKESLGGGFWELGRSEEGMVLGKAARLMEGVHGGKAHERRTREEGGQMNIIVVDDEPLALRGIARLVREAADADEVREFSLPRTSLAYAREHHVDVAFLDIEMPGMGGLELAKALKDENPDTRIVFVTSYEQYAIDAFAVRATGYLLKPARLEDVRRELTFIYDERRAGARQQSIVRVRTFGGFEAEVDGAPLAFKRSKSKELFALLVDRRGCGVTTREACAALWEDAPYSASQRSYFRNIVADLRAALAAVGAEEVLVRSRNSLAIDPLLIDCDSYRFLEGDVAAVNAYRGNYLPAYSWAEYSIGPFTRAQ